MDNPVWPLTGKRISFHSSALPLIPIWKRRGGVYRKVQRMGRFKGLHVSWDSEIAFEVNDPPGGEGWRPDGTADAVP